MASPMVAGAAVLAISQDPDLSLAALRARILAGVDRVPGQAGLVATGGRLDLCKVVSACTPPGPPTATSLVPDGDSAGY